MENNIEYQDSTTSTAGGRIPTTTYFKTLWQIKPFKLLKYESSWESPDNFSTPKELGRVDKLAITRHRKSVELKLGLRKEIIEKKVKIIYQNMPYGFLTGEFVEKPNSFLSTDSRISKIRNWVYWTEEKEKLLNLFSKRLRELEKLKEKIFKSLAELK